MIVLDATISVSSTSRWRGTREAARCTASKPIWTWPARTSRSGGIFIRAPWIDDAEAEVEVLAEHEGHPVLARQGRVLVAAFHPELTDDTRIHERFLDLVEEESHVRA